MLEIKTYSASIHVDYSTHGIVYINIVHIIHGYV